MTNTIAEFNRSVLTKSPRVPYKYPPERPVWEEAWEADSDVGNPNGNGNTTSLLENFISAKYSGLTIAEEKRTFLLNRRYR